MPRYFLEVSYKGTRYSGFQVQQNANTIQAEVEKAMLILFRENIILTGSSRTDAGVHALQNYFHFDFERVPGVSQEAVQRIVYKLNAILPGDIVVKNLISVRDNSHCRFDAVSREYNYYIYKSKNAFLQETAFYFPYKLNFPLMKEAAEMIREHTDFTSFSKRNTQAKTFICEVQESRWTEEKGTIIYNVKANRFLRGMVRGLTATMLKVGREKITLKQFEEIIKSRDCTKASFATPPHGLFLTSVKYPADYLAF